MSDPTSSHAAMLNDHEMIHVTETMFQDCKMILGDDDMVHSSEVIIGDNMGQDGNMIPDYKMVEIYDEKIIHGYDLIPGSETNDCNQVVIHGSEMAQGSEMANGNDTAEVMPPGIHGGEMVDGSELANCNDTAEVTAASTSRRQRKTSIVWEHFTREVHSEGCIRACCNHCKKTFAYSSGSKIAGTSHLKRHITDSCPMLNDHGPPSVGGTDSGGQNTVLKPSKRRRTYSGYTNTPFNQDRSSAYLAKMIIMHDYPLNIAQQPSFVSFIEGLQPRFKVTDTDVMEAEVYAVYLKERNNLMNEIGNIPGRINLTVGSWTTSQTLGYISIAAQFIDLEWKLHRRMLNFVMIPWPCPENAVGEAISKSLPQWNMKDKLFTITVDYDCPSHDIHSMNLRDHLTKKDIPMFGGQLFVVRCYAHILNSGASDVTASVLSIIYHIRESIKFIKSCPNCEQKFSDIVRQLQIPSTKTLCLDIITQWNTTYLMLLAAMDYRQAFTMLEKCDDNYNQAPSEVDWKKVDIACRYLKLLYDSAYSIMATADPTANIFFHEAWTIQQEISISRDLQDPVFSSITKDMHERFDKYWKDCNVVLAVAVVMDPRFKMKIVEFGYSKLHGPKAAKYIKVVDDAVHQLYKEYVTQPLPSKSSHVQQGGTDFLPTGEKSVVVNPPSNGVLSDFDTYISEVQQSQLSKSELDQYLEEALFPRVPEFDILNWWKQNSLKYPTLSRMARDVLAIPVATVSSGSSIFTAGAEARILDDYRSSLRPETMEALFCAKDWLQHSPHVPEAPSSASTKK